MVETVGSDDVDAVMLRASFEECFKRDCRPRTAGLRGTGRAPARPV